MGRWAAYLLALAGIVYATAACAAVFDVGAGGVELHARSADVFASTASSQPLASMRQANVRYLKAFDAAGRRYDLSPALLLAVARQESGLRADIVSSAGAIGIMQLMPKTAAELGVDPHDPTQNIMGGAAYLRQMLDRFDGHLDLALAAYNGGPRVAVHVGRQARETRAYVADCLNRLARSPFGAAHSNSTKWGR